ncbi:hypothetical protein K1719_022720 [Acacia pycnantha]|nr:hypothetical protein K1719_022720 [Acacia pycnantha]
MEASCASQNIKFLFTAVYGSPQKQYRRYIWQDLASLAKNISSPWILVGDFNAILHHNERQGGRFPEPKDVSKELFSEFGTPASISCPTSIRSRWKSSNGTLMFSVGSVRGKEGYCVGLKVSNRDLNSTPMTPPNDFLIDLEVSLREDLEEVCFQEELLWI